MQTRRKSGRPKAEETKQIIANVLSVAARSFLERGFANTRLEDIAQECGITRGAIYARYPTKGALFAAVCSMLANQFYFATVSQDDEATSLETALRQHTHAILGMVAENQGRIIYRLVTMEFAHADHVETSHRAVWSLYIQRMEGFFQKRIDRSEIAYKDAAHLARIFVCLILAEINLFQVMKVELPSAEEIYRNGEVLVSMFLAGLREMH